MKVAFALSAHLPSDERVCFQQAKCLLEAGCEVFICSSRTDFSEIPNSKCFDDSKLPKTVALRKLAENLLGVYPDVIICDTPIAVLAAKRCRKLAKRPVRILYDITEWYPSKKNLANSRLPKKMLRFAALVLLSLYAGFTADGFIFGEYYKSLPFRKLFFWKPFIFLSYYADIQQIKTYEPKISPRECTLFYAGNLTQDKGFPQVLKIAEVCADRFPEARFTLKIISKTKFENPDKYAGKNLAIHSAEFMPFPDFCREFGNADLFLDLRENDPENTRCLPIKIFYYMAAARPVIYSDLKAIRKEIPEISEFGFLVNPQKTDEIVEKIAIYMKDKNLYESHCTRARLLAEKKYNWKNIEKTFTDFVKQKNIP